MRLFTAIDLPDSIVDQLESICCGVPAARWLPPEQLHLTLRFIGEVDGAMVQDIREALAEIQGSEFSLQISGVGCFPSTKQPRILWAGVRPNHELLHFQKKLESHLVRTAGLAPDQRKYHPHITLARLKGSPDHRVARFLEEYALLECNPFSVTGFALYSSQLSPKGAQHFLEDRYVLLG